MPKRATNALTLLSAVVCVGSAMWVGRSIVYADEAYLRIGADRGFWAGTIDGALYLRRRGALMNFQHMSYGASETRSELNDFWRDAVGLRWLGIGGGKIGRERFLVLPLWLLPLLTAIAPVRWWRKRRREAGRGFAVGAASGG